MAKFRINERVYVPSLDQYGVVRIHDVLHDHEKMHTESKYYVLLEGEERNYEWFRREQLQKCTPKEQKKCEIYAKTYQADNNRSVTLVAEVITFKVGRSKFRDLFIGASFYNGVDDYDALVGYKIAKSRIKTSPFCTMHSGFGGEFNADTVNAIMDAKGKYLVEHIDEFVNKAE